MSESEEGGRADEESPSNMAIVKLSHFSASVEGKKEIILLCGQIDKDDIEIVFSEEKDNEIIWTGFGEFSPHDVHHNVAITFRTPAYKIQNVRTNINCFIYLRRKTDGAVGRPRIFTLLPIRKEWPSDMAIVKLSHFSASVEGNEELILLCEQIDADDIEIVFSEEEDNEIIWTGFGEFSPHDVHHNVAITFRTPAYKIQNVCTNINCFIYLRRKSDGAVGKPMEFTLLPIEKELPSNMCSNLAIVKLSHLSASIEGKKEIILLCEQIDKDDIEIVFSEENDSEVLLSGFGEFSPHDVHHNVAITFRTPEFNIQNLRTNINCFIYLRRKSDGAVGRPREFTLLPTKQDPEAILSKRHKFRYSPILRDFQ